MRASRRRDAGASGPKGDINVTPLVDVVLVLLIIFMVITPMLQRGQAVELPLTKNPKKAEAIKEQITISVMVDGSIFWETTPLDDEELYSRMSDAWSKTPTVPIFIKGDDKANYGRVRRVMKVINDAGFEGIGIITEELEKKASK